MTTERSSGRPPPRRPAIVSRIVTAGVAVATGVLMGGAMAGNAGPADQAAPNEIILVRLPVQRSAAPGAGQPTGPPDDPRPTVEVITAPTTQPPVQSSGS